MYYLAPRKPKLAVIYTRDNPKLPDPMTAEDREAICREHCAASGIPVLESVRVRCSDSESLDVLRYLLRTLPPQVDTLLAVRFLDYSTRLVELGRLCLVFQCRKIWVHCLDPIGPLSRHIPTLIAEDYQMADDRYAELMKQT